MSSAAFFSSDHVYEAMDQKMDQKIVTAEGYDSDRIHYYPIVSNSNTVLPHHEMRYDAYGAYNYALHTTCSAVQSERQWQDGYEKLFTLLRNRAECIYPDIWEDVVQSAVEQVYCKVDRCRDPHAFFQFAWGYVQNAARNIRMQNGSHILHMVSLEQRMADGQASLAEHLEDPSVAIEATVLVDELQQEIRTRIALIEKNNPQAHRQFAAIKLKYFDGLDDECISQRLAVPVKSVYELRSRGLQKLRRDPVLHRLFAQYQDTSSV